MAERIACPECGGVLHLPRDLTAPWVECPRCGRQIRNPQAKDEEPTPGEGERTLSCPSCGKGVEDHWLCCPHCDGPLGETGADTEVSRFDTRKRTALELLAALGILGVTLSLMHGLTGLFNRNLGPLFLTLIGLFLLTLVSWAINYIRADERSSLPMPARIAVGTLVLAGALVAGGCLLGAAVYILLLVVCAFV